MLLVFLCRFFVPTCTALAGLCAIEIGIEQMSEIIMKGLISALNWGLN